MSAERVRLTKAQREVLTYMLKGPAFYRHTTVAQLRQGRLVKAATPARGGAWYEITPAGRAALTAETGGRNEGS